MDSIFTPAVQAQIAALVRHAATHPLDYRSLGGLLNPIEFQRQIMTMRLVISPVTITYTHDLLPPDWQPYQHLAATKHGARPEDELFNRIAAKIGMGDPASWLGHLAEIAEKVSDGRVRHAFARV